MLVELARRQGLLTKDCEIKMVKRPRDPESALIADFLKLYDWLVDNACKLASADRISDVVSEDTAYRLYVQLLNKEAYRAFRRSLYAGLEVPRWGRVLLLGAGLIEPANFVEAAQMLGVRPDFAVQEVDREICEELMRLSSSYNYTVYCGYDIGESFDGVVVQNVLHWAEDPQRVLIEARRLGRRMLCSQGVIEGASVGFL
ncbi:class I SAM-dependent methyltransferase [Thermoproteus tenax]|nr:class I SAM-dependent methyltransferase [Thermoproteus tenax]